MVLWVVAFGGVIWAAAVVVMVAGGVRAARKQVEMAADMAALAAAARTVRGYADGCAVAERVAVGGGARLDACRVSGSAGAPVVVEVVASRVLSTPVGRQVTLRAVSRAGTPPPGSARAPSALRAASRDTWGGGGGL